MKDDIRMNSREWSKNLWSRIKALFGGLDTRVTALEQGGGGGGSVTVVDGDPTLSWGTRSTVGTVAGTALHATMPAKPTYTAADVGALPYPLILSSGDISQANNGVSQETGLAIYIKDSHGVIIGGVEFGLSPNGDVFADIISRNNVSGSMQQNMIRAVISKSGVKTYNITDGAAYRDAISAQADVGFYIDTQGYICQSISSDT